MIVDVHAHLFHPRWYPRAFCRSLVDDFVQRSRASGRNPNPVQAETTMMRTLSDDTGNMTVRLMDKCGVDVKIILVLDWGIELGEADCSIQQIHEEILGICAKFEDRLVGYAGIDPRRRGAVELVERAIDSQGARGLKLHPTGEWQLSDESTHKVVAVAAKRGLPTLVHVGKTLDILNDRNAQPRALIELARCFPEGKFVAGHSGWELFEVFLNEPNLPDNLYLDVSAWQPWLESEPAALDARLTKLIQNLPERVCYGSDGPFFTYNLVGSEKGWLTHVTGILAALPEEKRRAARGVLSGQNIVSPPKS
jgi:predicted TIM-barrel fold metal-dependent hydrolase